MSSHKHIKSQSLFKEEFVVLSERDDVVELLKSYTPLAENEEPLSADFPYVGIVYTTSIPPKLIAWSYVELMPSKPETTFFGFLDKINPMSLDDCIYLSTIYDPFKKYSSLLCADPFSRYNGKTDSFLDTFFRESRGYLLYSHQLEHLYMTLTGCTADSATRFRKGMYRRDAGCSAYLDAHAISLSDGTPLIQVIEERQLFSSTLPATRHGGYNLYNLLFRSTKEQT